MLLDERGKACPLPVIEAKRALEAGNGETLEVIVDNEIAVQNLKKLAKQKQLNCTDEQKATHEYHVYFAQNAGEAACPACTLPETQSGLVVALGSNRMGQGDDALGHVLMKAYIYALAQLDALPETILLYNGGAFLSCEGSDSLEDLREMESRGTRILTCGTCLNHYGLTERLAVGSVTNMYEIVETQARASKVLKP